MNITSIWSAIASYTEQEYQRERARVMADLLDLAEELETAPKTYLHSKDSMTRTIAMMDRARCFMSPTKPEVGEFASGSSGWLNFSNESGSDAVSLNQTSSSQPNPGKEGS